MKKSILFLLIFIGSIFFSFNAHADKTDGPWKGQVVDAETGQPIEGASIIIYWDETYFSIPESHESFLDAKEFVTDKDGRFYIPRQSISGKHWSPGQVNGPFWIFYKNGYDYHIWVKGNEIKSSIDKENLIKLSRLKSKEERIRMVEGIPLPGFEHEKYPETMKMIHLEEKELGLIK